MANKGELKRKRLEAKLKEFGSDVVVERKAYRVGGETIAATSRTVRGLDFSYRTLWNQEMTEWVGLDNGRMSAGELCFLASGVEDIRESDTLLIQDEDNGDLWRHTISYIDKSLRIQNVRVALLCYHRREERIDR